jgi:MFS family permease
MDKTLLALILSDIFVFTGFGLISPILAIFIKENLMGGTIVAAGIASAIFIIVHASLQIVFAKVFNPKDRLWMLWLGTCLIALVPFGYVLARTINHIYIIQIIYGIGAGFSYPAWYSLFSSHLEKGRRGLQWAIYNSGVGVGTAITAFVGGFLASKIGFTPVFLLTGAFAVAGLVILFGLEKKALKKI